MMFEMEGNSFMTEVMSTTFLGLAEKVEQEAMPLESQQALQPGDAAIVLHANTPLENDLTVVKVVDAGLYAEEFPDWEERVLLKSYVLCKAFSHHDPEERLGWFSRLKLLPISKYRYRQARRWLKVGFPEGDLPDWIQDAHDDFHDAIAAQVPEIVPHSHYCSSCGSNKVVLHVTSTQTLSARAGLVMIEDKEFYVPKSDVRTSHHHDAKLICLKCHTRVPLEDDSWKLS